MPICTSCAEPTAYLYTVYDSAYNFRLEQCTACHAFADPYVEHDTLTLLLDLILLKRDVYRHLLYNRGLGARKAGDPKAPTSTNPPDASSRSSLLPQRHSERDRWSLIFKLGAALICVDAFIRWTHINSSRTPHPGDTAATAAWSRAALHGFLRILVGCLFETAAFHAGVVLACYAVLRALPTAQAPVSGIREQFRYSHVPLTLLYSSLTKLFLLFCLSVWHPDAGPTAVHAAPPPLHPDAVFEHPLITGALSLLDADTLDRAWVVRNVLGGMAAGFGLRVVLDCHPVFTTIIIIAGWLVKTAVAGLVSGWVGTGLDADAKAAGEMWLAYSIP
ncbi:Arv1-domain-containing protein [Trametes versicolor FP-101664 SS1]|uniref:Arv1-domain-containing protein n=1 Tax=Trametes versicolor (strain FP-101664) TaxID=717944 RepID=UPI0004623AD5|nr:Arv1-domain-containing protein [Trametes versicolor FP-101664 SS1]EIW57494.1 Arv1-domain-containing protein [Trametes versicolor FP-101664 SS1]